MRGLKATPLILAMAGSLVLPGVARAQETWRVEVTPYAWLMALDGTFGTLPGLPASEATVSFGDLFDDLDYAGFLLATARHGRLAIHIDGLLSQTTSKQTLSGPLQAGTRIESGLAFLGAAIGYATIETPTARLEPYVGFRAWWLDTDLRVSLPGSGAEFTRSGDDDWVDPLLGVNGAYRLGDRWSAFASAEIGGFGVGSRFTWGALAGVRYEARDWLSLSAGWRHLYVNYRDGPSVYDVDHSGPVLGASFRF